MSGMYPVDSVIQFFFNNPGQRCIILLTNERSGEM